MTRPVLIQKLTLIDDPIQGCYLVCHTKNRLTGYRRISSIVLDKGTRRYRRIIRNQNPNLWNELRSMLP